VASERNPQPSESFVSNAFSQLEQWVYYSSQILLFGAEFIQVYAGRAGRGLTPAKYAVRVETKEIEDV
jgi:hypothetical protein